ncbi:hypothetical protein E1A91_D01G145000v1 [Gossypium mustelinum]|uniref:Uncharacterized protein n=1 Tax=Gossypium mustelinum TaxID=34275 RepID=A0A5D2W7E9_GOSMU|nr:hypothetical protein E1A91_D01G145000v1 [Gossypium mustelinum]
MANLRTSSKDGRRLKPNEGYSKGTSFSFLLFNGKNLFTKSKSVAWPSRMISKEGDDHKKKKGGFLSKLLHPKNTKTKGRCSSMAVFV